MLRCPTCSLLQNRAITSKQFVFISVKITVQVLIEMTMTQDFLFLNHTVFYEKILKKYDI